MKPDADLVDQLELRLFLEAVLERFGYDFRRYAEASLTRRVRAAALKRRLASISQLQHLVLHEEGAFAALLPELTVSTSEMFRDPSFFRVFREQVVPLLKTFPTVKLWHAGCSTGEEVYSTAI